ncbi:MAG: hypothetical protein QF722_01215 [Candidatus Thalassarchaeaceae archaeon]|nr:hypothetical protein [Candidatus Thalassarchaeaceae archaeon]
MPESEEHAGEFADTLGDLMDDVDERIASGDRTPKVTSNSDSTEFADIIDEKFIPGHVESVLSEGEIPTDDWGEAFVGFLVVGGIIWLLLGPESFFRLLWWLL